MTWIFLGAILLFFSILLVQGFMSADPKKLARTLRISGAILLALLSVPMLWRGNMALGLPMLGFAGMLLGVKTPFLKGGAGFNAGESPRARSGQSNMTRAEAFEVLGLKPGANRPDIIQAHKELMLKLHPDVGGNDYLATKLNQAKDLLLGE
jgi:hypothetical protein